MTYPETISIVRQRYHFATPQCAPGKGWRILSTIPICKHCVLLTLFSPTSTRGSLLRLKKLPAPRYNKCADCALPAQELRFSRKRKGADKRSLCVFLGGTCPALFNFNPPKNPKG